MSTEDPTLTGQPEPLKHLLGGDEPDGEFCVLMFRNPLSGRYGLALREAHQLSDDELLDVLEDVVNLIEQRSSR